MSFRPSLFCPASTDADVRLHSPRLPCLPAQAEPLLIFPPPMQISGPVSARQRPARAGQTACLAGMNGPCRKGMLQGS
jgi:hypothetical protein